MPTATGAQWRGPRARAARTAVVRGRGTMQATHMCSSMDAHHSCTASPPTHPNLLTMQRGRAFSRRHTTLSPPSSASRCSRGANGGAQASGVTSWAASRARRATQLSALPTAVGKGARSPTAAKRQRRRPRARALRTAVVRSRGTLQATHMCNNMDARHSCKAPHTSTQLRCNGDVLSLGGLPPPHRPHPSLASPGVQTVVRRQAV